MDLSRILHLMAVTLFAILVGLHAHSALVGIVAFLAVAIAHVIFKEGCEVIANAIRSTNKPTEPKKEG